MIEPIMAYVLQTPKAHRPRLYIGVYHRSDVKTGGHFSTSAYDDDRLGILQKIAVKDDLVVFTLPGTDDLEEWDERRVRAVAKKFIVDMGWSGEMDRENVEDLTEFARRLGVLTACGEKLR